MEFRCTGVHTKGESEKSRGEEKEGERWGRG